MIKSLYIKNYAIIPELNIEFNDSFNVFTGETGAGKSIIVGALSFLIKGKADPSFIKANEEKAIIEGVFDLDEDSKKIFDEEDIDYDDEIIVRRTIKSDGKSSIKVNNTTVTLNFLQKLFENKIDIHSQRDTQYLLNKKNHTLLLDNYAGNEKYLIEYRTLYKNYLNLLNEYNELTNKTYSEAELDFLKYSYDELNDANISIEEENELLEKEKLYKNSEKYLNTLNNVVSLFDDDEGIYIKLTKLIKELNVDDDTILKIKNNIESNYYSLIDNIDEIRKILNSFENDDISIDDIEARLFLYSKLKRKYNLDTQNLILKKNELNAQIQIFNDRDVVLSEKKSALDLAYKNAKELAFVISNNRKAASSVLTNEIVNEGHDLMLNNIRFDVSFNDVELNVNGIDDLEFLISLNAGEDLKPLKNVASGGEISRLMLALKVIFTRLSTCSLIVFDEIDTGVSGKVALAIGKKMAKIAKNCQVLTITHLAQVAACANEHFYIYKEDTNNITNTKIKKLNKQEIINELAKISSVDSSELAISAAEELYNNVQESIKC